MSKTAMIKVEPEIYFARMAERAQALTRVKELTAERDELKKEVSLWKGRVKELKKYREEVVANWKHMYATLEADRDLYKAIAEKACEEIGAWAGCDIVEHNNCPVDECKKDTLSCLMNHFRSLVEEGR